MNLKSAEPQTTSLVLSFHCKVDDAARLIVTGESFYCLICLTLSIISRRILPFPEMTELDGIPRNNFFCNNLGYELTGIMAITTALKVLDNADRSPRGHTDKPKSNIQFLTMMVENNAFLLAPPQHQEAQSQLEAPNLPPSSGQTIYSTLHIFSAWGCHLFPTMNVCILSLTSIQLLPGIFFTLLSFISSLTFSTSSHLPAVA